MKVQPAATQPNLEMQARKAEDARGEAPSKAPNEDAQSEAAAKRLESRLCNGMVLRRTGQSTPRRAALA